MKFVLGYDARKNLVALAEQLADTAWAPFEGGLPAMRSRPSRARGLRTSKSG